MRTHWIGRSLCAALLAFALAQVETLYELQSQMRSAPELVVN